VRDDIACRQRLGWVVSGGLLDIRLNRSVRGSHHDLSPWADHPDPLSWTIRAAGNTVQLGRWPVGDTLSPGPKPLHWIVNTLMSSYLDGIGESDVCRCSVPGRISRRVVGVRCKRSVSGRAEAPRIAGWLLVLTVPSSRVLVGVVLLVRFADWFAGWVAGR
jgi:hypothetical protein